MDAVKRTTLALVLASVGLLSAAALAAVPVLGPPAEQARAGKCEAATLRIAPARSTVERLVTLRAPRNARARGGRAKPRVYAIEADLVGASSTRGATRLVVSPRGRPAPTMVLALDGACPKRSAVGRATREARATLTAACGALPRSFTQLRGRVSITGLRHFGRAKPGSLGAPNGIELRPVLRLRAVDCGRRAPAPPPQKPPVVGAAVQAPVPAPPTSTPPPQPEPQPEPDAGCTATIPPGAIEAEANRAPGRVLCLETGYYQELRDALIVITQRDVHIRAVTGAHPIVCGRFVLRGAGTSVAPDVDPDPACAPYFNEASPWNRAAAEYPASVPVPPAWLPDFDGGTGTTSLQMARSWEHGKAIFKAAPGDPVTATFRIADATQCFDDPAGCVAWQPADPTHRVADETAAVPERIPIPAGVRCPGLPLIDNDHDRALTIVSADGRTAWELWHCTHAATPQEPWYTAGVATKWSLDPDDPSSLSRGFQDEGLGSVGSTSARGSGTPLLTTTVTPLEAVRGIHHPLGLTVARVSNLYENPPASPTDGCAACSNLRYGMLFVLDPAFRPARQPRLGDLNVIQALKLYGAYVVDQSPVFELDGSPNEPTAPAASDTLWEASGIDLVQLGIKPSDLRYVPTPGAPPATP